jgi:hypothetical protein
MKTVAGINIKTPLGAQRKFYFHLGFIHALLGALDFCGEHPGSHQRFLLPSPRDFIGFHSHSAKAAKTSSDR